MLANAQLTQDKSDDDHYDEVWKVRISSGGIYDLGKYQARILQQEIASGSRGIVMFKTFSISIPYVAEFYMEKRFLKDSLQLPATATEEPYVPIPKEQWEKIKEEAYKKIGIIK